MATRFNSDEIRRFWTEQATKHPGSPTASWSDVPVIELEIAEISSRLVDGDRVIDVGCANGYSTATFAHQKKIHIRGVDYIPEMIAQAQARLVGAAAKFPGSVEFAVGDVTGLSEPSGKYDKVISTRVIINLPTWEQQKVGLHELSRILRPGGCLLLSEATLQGWQKLNRFREEWGLAPIPMPAFNLYLDEEKVAQELANEMRLVEIVNFASTYYVGTRLLKPLLSLALKSNINVADPHSEWNRWFASLPSAGDYGTQKLFVFQKK
jgi:ubiquinone/menaquinone biosynthesis C-methylase UbiE